MQSVRVLDLILIIAVVALIVGFITKSERIHLVFKGLIVAVAVAGLTIYVLQAFGVMGCAGHVRI